MRAQSPILVGLLMATSILVAGTGDRDGTPGLWTGAVDNNWANRFNWGDSLVPTDSTRVLIPSGRPRYPTTNSAVLYDCARLEVQPGAAFTVAAGTYFTSEGALVVGGAFTNYGEADVWDTCLVTGTLVNNDTMFLQSGDNRNNGTVTNNGCLYYDALENRATVVNGTAGYVDAAWDFNYGQFTNNGFYYNGAYFENHGTYTNNDTCYLDDQAVNDSSGILLNGESGWICIGDISNHGTFTNRGHGTEIYGMDNFGRVVNSESLWVESYEGYEGSSFANDSAARADIGYMRIEGTVVNNGLLVCSECEMWNQMVNNGELNIIDGELDAAGSFINVGRAVLTNSYFCNDEVVVNNGFLSLDSDLDNGGNFTSGPASEVRIRTDGGSFDLSTNGPGTCAFDRLVIEAESSQYVRCDGSFRIQDALEVVSGGFVCDESYLSIGTASAPGSVVIDSAARISFEGRVDRPTTLAATDPGFPYGFEVRPGGRIGAGCTRFLHMNSAGIKVAAGAFVDDSLDFSNCTFLHGNLTGPMLKVENGQELEIQNASFIGSAGHNIEKTGSTGHISVSGGAGSRWGEEFDHDPNNLVDWGTASVPAWTEVASMPTGTKPVKDGGWLAYDPSWPRIYAARGNKSGDFFSYDPTGDSWTQLAAQPGCDGKLPGKGAVAVSANAAVGYGSRWWFVYATVGNSTSGFFLFNPDSNRWIPRASVPLGTSNKKVKGGTDLAFVPRTWWRDTGYVYLLKGIVNEFYRYCPNTDTWKTMPAPPPGAKPKWDKGSFLVFDGDRTIYAHKAKYNEAFAFDVETETWDPATLPGLPLLGRSGKSKKAKDGSCGTWYGGLMYALKGGNTQELWAGDPRGSAWYELDTMPAIGRSLKKKKVKAGADIVTFGSVLYALKGNGTNELWRYEPKVVLGAQPKSGRYGVMQSGSSAVEPGLSVTPNPLTGHVAALRWSLPRPARAQLTVWDAVGRVVRQMPLAAGAGQAHADLGGLSPGIYVVQLSTPAASWTCKVVLQP